MLYREDVLKNPPVLRKVIDFRAIARDWQEVGWSLGWGPKEQPHTIKSHLFTKEFHTAVI